MSKRREQGFPGRDAILAFIRAHPGKVGTREIAREFGLKNADRVELKRILRDLAILEDATARAEALRERGGAGAGVSIEHEQALAVEGRAVFLSRTKTG